MKIYKTLVIIAMVILLFPIAEFEIAYAKEKEVTLSREFAGTSVISLADQFLIQGQLEDVSDSKDKEMILFAKIRFIGFNNIKTEEFYYPVVFFTPSRANTKSEVFSIYGPWFYEGQKNIDLSFKLFVLDRTPREQVDKIKRIYDTYKPILSYFPQANAALPFLKTGESFFDLIRSFIPNNPPKAIEFNDFKLFQEGRLDADQPSVEIQAAPTNGYTIGDRNLKVFAVRTASLTNFKQMSDSIGLTISGIFKELNSGNPQSDGVAKINASEEFKKIQKATITNYFRYWIFKSFFSFQQFIFSKNIKDQKAAIEWFLEYSSKLPINPQTNPDTDILGFPNDPLPQEVQLSVSKDFALKFYFTDDLVKIYNNDPKKIPFSNLSNWKIWFDNRKQLNTGSVFNWANKDSGLVADVNGLYVTSKLEGVFNEYAKKSSSTNINDFLRDTSESQKQILSVLKTIFNPDFNVDPFLPFEQEVARQWLNKRCPGIIGSQQKVIDSIETSQELFKQIEIEFSEPAYFVKGANNVYSKTPVLRDLLAFLNTDLKKLKSKEHEEIASSSFRIIGSTLASLPDSSRVKKSIKDKYDLLLADPITKSSPDYNNPNLLSFFIINEDTGQISSVSSDNFYISSIYGVRAWEGFLSSKSTNDQNVVFEYVTRGTNFYDWVESRVKLPGLDDEYYKFIISFALSKSIGLQKPGSTSEVDRNKWLQDVAGPFFQSAIFRDGKFIKLPTEDSKFITLKNEIERASLSNIESYDEKGEKISKLVEYLRDPALSENSLKVLRKYVRFPDFIQELNPNTPSSYRTFYAKYKPVWLNGNWVSSYTIDYSRISNQMNSFISTSSTPNVGKLNEILLILKSSNDQVPFEVTILFKNRFSRYISDQILQSNKVEFLESEIIWNNNKWELRLPSNNSTAFNP